MPPGPARQGTSQRKTSPRVTQLRTTHHRGRPHHIITIAELADRLCRSPLENTRCKIISASRKDWSSSCRRNACRHKRQRTRGCSRKWIDLVLRHLRNAAEISSAQHTLNVTQVVVLIFVPVSTSFNKHAAVENALDVTVLKKQKKPDQQVGCHGQHKRCLHTSGLPADGDVYSWTGPCSLERSVASWAKARSRWSVKAN